MILKVICEDQHLHRVDQNSYEHLDALSTFTNLDKSCAAHRTMKDRVFTNLRILTILSNLHIWFPGTHHEIHPP